MHRKDKQESLWDSNLATAIEILVMAAAIRVTIQVIEADPIKHLIGPLDKENRTYIH